MTTRRSRYRDLTRAHPDVVEAYERLRAACESAGPLDPRAAALVRLAVSIGRGSSRSVHAHARKALEAGAAPDAVRHVGLLALPTLGLPAGLDAIRWIDEIIEEHLADEPPTA